MRLSRLLLIGLLMIGFLLLLIWGTYGDYLTNSATHYVPPDVMCRLYPQCGGYSPFVGGYVEANESAADTDVYIMVASGALLLFMAIPFVFIGLPGAKQRVRIIYVRRAGWWLPREVRKNEPRE